MKKLVIFGVIVVVFLAAVALALAAYNANSLLTRYQPEIERLASQTLGKHVSFGQLKVSVFPKTAIQASEVKIANRSDSPEAFRLNNLLLRLELMPLLSRQLVINQLEIITPDVTLIKDSEGVRIEGLPAAGKSRKKEQTTAKQSIDQAKLDQSETKTTNLPFDIRIDRISLRNATVSFQDTVAKKEYNVDKINLEIGLKLQKDLVQIPKFDLSAMLMGRIPLAASGEQLNFNLTETALDIEKVVATFLDNKFNLNGKINFKTQQGQFKINSAGIKLASLDGLGDLIPAAVKELNLTGSLIPDLTIQLVTKNNYIANGSVELAGIGLKSGEVKLSELAGKMDLSSSPDKTAAEISNLDFKLNQTHFEGLLKANLIGHRASLEKLGLRGLAGTIDLSSSYLLSSKDFSAEAQLAGISIEQLVSTFKPNQSAKLTGTLSNLSLRLNGTVGSDLMQSLRGSGRLLLENGAIKDFNLAEQVLKSVKDLPFLSAALLAAVPAQQKNSVDAADTPIKSLSCSFNLANRRLQTPDLKLVSSVFSLESDGTVDLSGQLDLNATIIFTPEFSQALAKNKREIERILDAQGRLVIPLTLKGIAPKIMVIPNIKKLAEIGATRAVKDTAEKLLDRALGGKKERGTSFGIPGLGF